ncbi:hypothetical protein ACF061_11820 [Streptomyces sp. NPDC015220]|uniref:hypothetical protein n=1 Tax=Streptomyces sp. NPDC015220 TaxID=3364947 RepID=UPI0037023EEA
MRTTTIRAAALTAALALSCAACSSGHGESEAPPRSLVLDGKPLSLPATYFDPAVKDARAAANALGPVTCGLLGSHDGSADGADKVAVQPTVACGPYLHENGVAYLTESVDTTTDATDAASGLTATPLPKDGLRFKDADDVLATASSLIDAKGRAHPLPPTTKSGTLGSGQAVHGTLSSDSELTGLTAAAEPTLRTAAATAHDNGIRTAKEITLEGVRVQPAKGHQLLLTSLDLTTTHGATVKAAVTVGSAEPVPVIDTEREDTSGSVIAVDVPDESAPVTLTLTDSFHTTSSYDLRRGAHIGKTDARFALKDLSLEDSRRVKAYDADYGDRDYYKPAVGATLTVSLIDDGHDKDGDGTADGALGLAPAGQRWIAVEPYIDFPDALLDPPANPTSDVTITLTGPDGTAYTPAATPVFDAPPVMHQNLLRGTATFAVPSDVTEVTVDERLGLSGIDSALEPHLEYRHTFNLG